MSLFIKHVADWTGALIALLVLGPLMLLIAAAILVIDGRPILFRQVRVGRAGRPFRMYKFRTMTAGTATSTVSVVDDPNITKLGSFLRRYKLDELPELLNVLKGDMSFVGPRPDVPGFADELQGVDREILALKPGLTGPASIKYAREEELLASVADPVRYNREVIYPDKVRINRQYTATRTLLGDAWIILVTLVRCLRR
jgi:lipopolysaccharide/colanic/teichoic acid biosynthesis glycosyltransferase